jgi:hypothetical protein
VYVNDQLKGESPVTYDFMWYGWHRVTLRKAGFERMDDRQQLRAPSYFWIPFDLVMELLPWPIRDVRTWSYALTPTVALPTPAPPATIHLTPNPLDTSTPQDQAPGGSTPSAPTTEIPSAAERQPPTGPTTP